MDIKLTFGGYLPKTVRAADVIEHILAQSKAPMDAQDINAWAYRTWGWSPAKQNILTRLRLLCEQGRAVLIRKGVYAHPTSSAADLVRILS
jgi:hypothetical protein